jgi:hypothetical protein
LTAPEICFSGWKSPEWNTFNPKKLIKCKRNNVQAVTWVGEGEDEPLGIRTEFMVPLNEQINRKRK